MKKILYYFAQGLLLIVSLMLGFISSTEMLILCLSCLSTGAFMMLYYCFKTPNAWPGGCLYGVVVFCHLFFLASYTSFAGLCMAGLAAFFIFAVGGLVYMVRKGFSFKDMLSFALFEKTALVPEILLNWLMNRASDSNMFVYFNWVLLALTSAYVIACLARMLSLKNVTNAWAVALGLLQFFFFTDIIGAAILLVLAWRWKAPQPAKKTRIYQKASFSGSKKMKPKRNS